MYSKGLAYLLWLLSGFGALGFHRFYLGKPLSALVWMFTGGLMGIGSLYDLFTLGSQVDIANARQAVINGGGAWADAGGWRYVKDGSARIVRDKDNLDSIILRIVRKNGGIVTPSEVVIEANVTLDKARKHLEKMAIDGHAEMRIRKSGVIVFTFPEFMDGSVNIDDL
jgi:TM2 domain-containing membrane protein YozV/predicted transcriptional regulator